MELKHLRYFAAAVEEGSIMGAAQRMHVAQPAMSRRIRDLEEMLGCELLVRNTRGVSTTPAGMELYRQTLILLDGIGQTIQSVRHIGQTQRREARLGLVQTARKYAFIQTALAAFRAQDAGSATFEWGPSSRLAQTLREGSLDITFLYEHHLDTTRFGERLIHAERYVLGIHPTHPLAGVGAVDLAQISGQPLVWLSRRDNADNHDALLQRCRLLGLEPVIGQLADSQEEQIDLTITTGGICLTPASTMLSTPRDQLVFRSIRGFPMELELSLGWNAELNSSAAVSLLAQLHEAIDRHQAEIRSGRPEWCDSEGQMLFRVPQ